MKKIKEETPASPTTSGNIGVLPEAPPFGKLKVKHSKESTKNDKLKKITIRMPASK